MPVIRQILEVVGSALGSQTFWGAVEAIGVVASLFFIGKQLAGEREQLESQKAISSYEFLRKEDERYRSEAMKEARKLTAQLIRDRPDDAAAIHEAAIDLLNFFEDLGVLLESRVGGRYFV